MLRRFTRSAVSSVPFVRCATTKIIDTPPVTVLENAGHRACNTHHGAPLVLDVPFVVPSVPADDVLLSDLKWSALKEAFPDEKVHKPVKPGEEPMFNITTGQRTLALLPVRTVVARQKGEFMWVPFLIDTGSPSTFFTHTTIAELGLGSADHIEIWSDKRVVLRESSHHFDDINLLGTDFLVHCDLHIYYTANRVELVVPATAALPVAIWVQQRDRSGAPVGPAFKVSPAVNDVDALKKAIKAELSPKFPTLFAPEITIYAPDATAPAEPDLALSETDAKKPFHFILPS